MMSYVNRIRGNPQSVQKLLDENAQLIQAIVDYQNKGKAAECVQFQQLLHKNLMYLASLADTSQNMQAMIPPLPTTSQIPNITSVSTPMGISSGSVSGNLQDRKVLVGTSVDPGSTGIPNMTSQVISSAGSQMTSGIHTSPSAMTTVSADGTRAYGGNANMSPQTLDTNTQNATGYPGNVNQMMASNMAAASSRPMMPSQQQGYMQNMHATQMQQQHSEGQQFIMQRGVAMGYTRTPVQMHPSQQSLQPQQMNQQQPYTGNQAAAGQQTAGMLTYQQPSSSYDPYNPMQHMSSGYNNPYGPQ